MSSNRWLGLLGCMLLAAVLNSQPADRAIGTVSGRVFDADSGAPLRDFPVSGARTDAEGRFSLKLPSGPQSIQLLGERVWPPLAVMNVSVEAGKELSGVEVRVRLDGEISGRVIDEDEDPIAGMPVHLIGREYYAGALHSFSESTATTDDRGVYHFRNVRAGRALLIVAEAGHSFDQPISAAPGDPKLRLPVNRPTFYPNSESAQAAAAIALRSSEHREGLEIQVKRTTSYCISAVLANGGVPASLNFKVTNEDTGSANMVPGSASSGPPGVPSGADGKVRLCGFAPGTYRLAAFHRQGTSPDVFGSAIVAVDKQDVAGVRISAEAPVSVPVEVSWFSEPPDPSIPAKFMLMPRAVTNDTMQTRGSQTAVPGEFSMAALRNVEYLLTASVGSASAVPNAYVRDVVFGQGSVFHLPFVVTGSTDAHLRFFLGNDGGSIKATTAAGSHLLVVPASAASAAALQDALVTAEAGPGGTATTRALAPGKYWVLATNDLLDNTPEMIDALWRARTRGTEVDVAAKSTATVTVEAKPLR